jgi:hypothetical protein
MNLYTITITDENGTKGTTSVKARNKIIALNKGIYTLTSKNWRAADRIANIEVKEDAGNKELSASDYI